MEAPASGQKIRYLPIGPFPKKDKIWQKCASIFPAARSRYGCSVGLVPIFGARLEEGSLSSDLTARMIQVSSRRLLVLRSELHAVPVPAPLPGAGFPNF